MSQSRSRNSLLTTLFVGDLSFFCTEQELFSLFSSFGTVVNVEVKRSRSTGDSLLHAFVEMNSESAAQAAMQSLHDSLFMGRRLRVRWGSGPQDAMGNHQPSEWIQLHISFSSYQSDWLVNEEFLHRVFSSFGQVADVTVKRHHLSSHGGTSTQNGYGFVFYSHLESALDALEALRAGQSFGVYFQCGLSYKSERAVMQSAPVHMQQRLRKLLLSNQAHAVEQSMPSMNMFAGNNGMMTSSTNPVSSGAVFNGSGNSMFTMPVMSMNSYSLPLGSYSFSPVPTSLQPSVAPMHSIASISSLPMSHHLPYDNNHGMIVPTMPLTFPQQISNPHGSHPASMSNCPPNTGPGSGLPPLHFSYGRID